MRLADAASYFDKLLCVDAFASGTTFYGQLDLFDDSKRDGATVSRRVLSVAPAVAIPSRRVITFGGEQWLIGAHESDFFQGAAIRDKWILHRASGAATIRTPAQTLASAGGTSTYAARVWVKDQKELEVSSHLTAFYNIYLPSTDVVVAGNIVGLGGSLHIVRGVLLSVAGFTVAESDEMGTATLVAGCTYKARTYTPATDVLTDAAPVTLAVLQQRFHSDYVYPNAAAPKMEPGDIKAVILKTAVTPVVDATLMISGVVWRVINVQSEDASCWALHLRLP